MDSTTSFAQHINHPALAHKVSLLRCIKTETQLFRSLTSEIAHLLAYEASRHFAIKTKTITTPVQTCTSRCLNHSAPMIIPLLRAGLGMVSGITALFPNAVVGHIGLKRDETTLQADCYYFNLPPQQPDQYVLVCDPMLATGHSAATALTRIKEVGIKNIHFLNILAAPEGIAYLKQHHPDIQLYTAAIDEHLNEQGYICPGLGDAGDRLFGTI
ncbi:uracil phosphoribosyltransferase [Piscirickettsia salmonis]|uniref:uracil phosphoribosyltransferase n=1 Tax=Piscirickettsia salmonis TaxID=1238 RepID=UPI0002D84DD8|nr:uracil phosphoribosyltransferase [Piscirickettsia salmonis]APS57741.1 uracil phosphoribosyltransferase [Piscirickettsia salmonis]ERL62066.1 uracil phosphoribosyltransferase [Piscirickettsia salmonis LF-89 = ATCC VR-1361]PEQ15971.1 uracil phosphoribosyltransferase [Piscirickettsia salmonis]QGN76030.1 Uracil phosphoribosyltransferase [Piscirickettsia salmonis]QGN79593.1 Uracil phosphoribosyltransferase [Piscirickettsia salmonis]